MRCARLIDGKVNKIFLNIWCNFMFCWEAKTGKKLARDDIFITSQKNKMSVDDDDAVSLIVSNT